MQLDKGRIEVILARNCMSMSDLKKQNLHCGTLSRVITHGEACSTKTAGKIAKALGVDVTEILADKEE